ncbi:ISAs1 family transposase [Glutamicibacter uratoxydans]|nr:ISAs1 family transposase [Glutamicibacter uratoxydans]
MQITKPTCHQPRQPVPTPRQQYFRVSLFQLAQTLSTGKATAMDGKEIQGTKNGRQNRVHLPALVDQHTGAVCAQMPVGAKTNQITQFSAPLVHFLDLKGKVTTADALHTQTPHARYLRARGAHYVFTVKGSHPKLQDELQQIPRDQVPVGSRNVEMKNGRRTIRTIRTIKCVTLTTGFRFPHAAQARQITRKSRVVKATRWRTERVHALTSLLTHLASPADIGALIRGHRVIEHGLHWRRDVTWNEDKSQVRQGYVP